jgi:hypothetical protein
MAVNRIAEIWKQAVRFTKEAEQNGSNIVESWTQL